MPENSFHVREIMIILSFLGATKLDETEYVWDLRTPQSTDSFLVALNVWFPKADIYVLETEKAREVNGVAARIKLPNARFIPIPNGRSDDENWQIFNTLADALPEDAELVFDITNGFRSLPVLSMLVVSFLRSVKKLNLKHLVYAAFERDVTPTPVFDLTPFVTMLDWASATNRFLETGDARKFKDLVTIRGASIMNNVGSELEKLSIELALHRSVEAMETAKRVLEKIKQADSESPKPEHQPFHLLKNRILDAVQPISGAGIAPEIYSQFAQIMWYAKQKQYAQGISLAREWLVAVRIWKTDGWFSVSREEQEIAENWLNTMSKALKDKPQIIPPNWLAAVKMWDKISDQRNDYAHFGMRKSVISAKETLKNAQIILDELRIAVAPLGLELPEVSG